MFLFRLPILGVTVRRFATVCVFPPTKNILERFVAQKMTQINQSDMNYRIVLLKCQVIIEML